MRQRRPSKEEKSQPIEIEASVLLGESWGLGAPPSPWVEDQSHVGKAFARLETAEGPMCLRRLPAGVSPGWLEAVQNATRYVESRGFNLFPRFIATETGDLAVNHAGRWYDLTVWMTGQPLAPDALSDDQVESLGLAVGRLHAAGQGADGPLVRFDWLTSVQAETQRLAWDPVARGKAAWQKPGNLAAFFDAPLGGDADARSNPTVQEIRDLAQRALSAFGPNPLAVLAGAPPTLTHGDLWPEHARFEGYDVTALLDLDTLALRPPGGDVAALCADFALWEPGRVQGILDAYRREQPFPAEAVAELPGLGVLRGLGILRARLNRWREARGRAAGEEELERSTAFWRAQLRTILALPPGWPS